jgi:hypothetical protein
MREPAWPLPTAKKSFGKDGDAVNAIAGTAENCTFVLGSVLPSVMFQ